MSKKSQLNEIFDYVKQNCGQQLGDIADVQRGALNEKDRPKGVCWPCSKLAKEAMLHESPGTAKCCIGCDAYRGEL